MLLLFSAATFYILAHCFRFVNNFFDFLFESFQIRFAVFSSVLYLTRCLRICQQLFIFLFYLAVFRGWVILYHSTICLSTAFLHFFTFFYIFLKKKKKERAWCKSTSDPLSLFSFFTKASQNANKQPVKQIVLRQKTEPPALFNLKQKWLSPWHPGTCFYHQPAQPYKQQPCYCP